MSKSKFFDFIWKTNGILILLVFLALLISLAFEKLPSVFQSNQVHDIGVIVGSKLEKAKELDIDLQHLIYDSIKKINNSEYYLTEVIVLDKEIPVDHYKLSTHQSKYSIRW